jgi:hypothetical protein
MLVGGIIQDDSLFVGKRFIAGEPICILKELKSK